MSEHQPSPSRRRILMLTTDVQIDRRILQEAEALLDENNEVILLAGGGPGLTSHEFVGRVKVHRIALPGFPPRARRLWLRAMRRFVIRPYLRTRTKLSAALRHLTARRFPLTCRSHLEQLYYQEGLFYRPDIVHAHDLPMLPVAAQLKEALGVPLVYDMHESYPEQRSLTRYQQTILRRDERQHIRAADVVITVNPLLLDYFREQYDLPCAGVVQNAMTTRGFDVMRHHDRFREDYPHLRDKFLVLFQGWVSPERNLETAVKALPHTDRADIVLLVMGYGDYTRELQALAASHGVADRVVVVPAKSQEELLSYSASADIGLIPYPKDLDVNTRLASPNKLYEFIAARLPILANRLAFVQSVVEKWGFGLTADLEDVGSFAAVLNALDKAKLDAFRANLARDGWRFTWEQERKQLLALYEKLPLPVLSSSLAAA